MKKLSLLLFLIALATLPQANAQDAAKDVTKENSIITGLKPENGVPMIFLDKASADRAKEQYLPVYRRLIVENPDDTKRILLWRELIWRIENAEVRN